MKKLLLLFTVLTLVLLPMAAVADTFYTPAGAGFTDPDPPNQFFPVSASADFQITPGTLTIVLTNLLANPTSVIQCLSDLKFDLNTTTDYTSYTSSGNQIYIGVAGVPIAGISTGWALTQTGSSFYLNGLVPKDVTGDGIIDVPSGPKHTIIGPGPYTNANASINGNGPHNPFLDQTATFVIGIPGLDSIATVSNVVFSFGTAPGNDIAAPIPGSLLLLGSGILGLLGWRRLS